MQAFIKITFSENTAIRKHFASINGDGHGVPLMDAERYLFNTALAMPHASEALGCDKTDFCLTITHGDGTPDDSYSGCLLFSRKDFSILDHIRDYCMYFLSDDTPQQVRDSVNADTIKDWLQATQALAFEHRQQRTESRRLMTLDNQAKLNDINKRKEQAKAQAQEDKAKAEQERLCNISKGQAIIDALPAKHAAHEHLAQTALPYHEQKKGFAVTIERRVNKSDLMTDYFAHDTQERFSIAFCGSRVSFKSWRNALILWLLSDGPDAAGLCDEDQRALAALAESGDEHRENWSMGGGYYISEKGKGRHSDGWCMKHAALGTDDALEAIGSGVLVLQAPKKPSKAKRDAATSDKDTSNAATSDKDTSDAATSDESASAAQSAVYDIQHHETNKGKPMCIVVAPRVERDEWNKRLAKAKELGGWYSRPYKERPEGFAFWDEATAAAFCAIVYDGDANEQQAPLCAKEPKPNKKAKAKAKPTPEQQAKASERMLAIAERLDTQAADKLAPRLENTPKRQREAASARIDGARMQRAAQIMRACADAPLAKQPTKKEALSAVSKPIERGAGYYAPPFEVHDVTAWHDMSDRAQALRAHAGLTDDKAKEQAAALAKESAKAAALADIRNAPPVGFFPTPKPVIDTMLEQVGDLQGLTVLEPSAGIGCLVNSALDAGAGHVHAIELVPSLCDYMREHATTSERVSILCDDALQVMRSQFSTIDAVLMNPPFERDQAPKHVLHALNMLSDGGKLCAVMPSNWQQTRKGQALASKLDSIGAAWGDLPQGDAFKSASSIRQTGVSVSVLIVNL